MKRIPESIQTIVFLSFIFILDVVFSFFRPRTLFAINTQAIFSMRSQIVLGLMFCFVTRWTIL